MTSVWYCSRETVQRATDSKETARNTGQIDRAIETASRAIEALTLRQFYPTTATRYFDWPRGSRPWRLWLDRDELISVTALVAGGTTIAAADYFLEPANTGPPYTHVEIDLASTAVFSAGDTHQRAIAVTGVFGHSADQETVGSLSAELGATAGATAAVTWTVPDVGVGNILRIDDERMIVTARTMVDTTQNLGGDLTASMGDVTVAVTTGTAFAADAILRIDSERMLVVDVAGNDLTVKRAWDGTVLAAHTGTVDIYALTGVTLSRAQLGTTIAVHASAASITRHVPPAQVTNLCVAEAINTLGQEAGGYARTVGSGEGQRDAGGAGLEGLRADVRRSFGRRTRVGAV